MGIWGVTACCAYFLAQHMAYKNFDRELLNSADSVVARLRSNPVKIWIDMPAAAQAVLRHNNQDKIYYQVLKTDGVRISGDAFLPKPLRNLDSLAPTFRFSVVNGERVRIVRVRLTLPASENQEVFVQVAMTMNAFNEMTQQFLFAVLFPQLVMMVLGALSVSYGVRRGLISLTLLEKSLLSRAPLNLEPVDASETPTEIRPLIDALNVVLKRLDKDIEQQTRFVANAAHQLRTPLAGLKTYVYAAKKIPCEDRMKDMLEKIEAGTDRMSGLANKLLTLARAEPHSSLHRFESVDLNFIASGITAEFVSEAVPKGISLSFSGSEHPALVNGESDDLTEMASNLIENAILYTQSGGNVSVRVANGKDVRLIVQDNGPGIAECEREKVFERFYRVLGTEAAGSGLGLPIVKEIALAHKASIEITDGEGSGTKVIVTFPCAEKKTANSQTKRQKISA
jgi:two-component system sensor histidine kinase TctE